MVSENGSRQPAVGSGTLEAASPDASCRLPFAQAALDAVCDPELPFLTIADLGILRGVAIDGETIVVTITPTYSGCPANDAIGVDIELAMARAGMENFRIEVVRAPAWTTDWITPAGRQKLAENGIAPPLKAGGKRALFEPDEATCPKCGSLHTEQVSAFGSTACKAHHRCLDCREPFEAFKCI